MFWKLGFGDFEKFWGFPKLMGFCEIFGIGFEDLILKTSCIAFHVHYNSIFMHFYGYFCAPLIIFMFLEWSFLASCTICQSWQKGGEILEICGFFLNILHVRGRNTCLCKGEMCFILLEGVFTSLFLYNGFVTMLTYIVLIFLICWCMFLSPTPYMCCFFSLFIHMLLITCMQSIISVSHKDALMCFV